MNLSDFFHSTEGILSGLGAFFVGVAAMWPHIVRLVESPSLRRLFIRVRRWALVTMGGLLLVGSAGVFVYHAGVGQESSLNAQMSSQAWDYFNRGRYKDAIASAEHCIDEFGAAANREQVELESKKTALPPTGHVSGEDKLAILARGPLNDAAVCYYIKGQAAEHLGRQEEAKQVYQLASKYTYARCWDPRGWLWAPAMAASDRLEALK